MKFNYNDYLIASAYRIETARRLHKQGRYSAAIYFAGISIECLLRAFIIFKDPEFDQRHNLHELCKKAGLEDLITYKHRREANAWLGNIWARWKNNYRYASDERLRAEFKKLGHDRGIKGDFLKQNSSIVVDSAYELRTMGEKRWLLKKNSKH